MALAHICHADQTKRASGGARIPEDIKKNWIGLVTQWRREGGTDQIVEENLGEISTVYFGIQGQRPQANLMMEMMNGLMGGGQGQKQVTNEQKSKVIRQAGKPAAVQPKEEVAGTKGNIEAPEEDDLD